MASSCGTGASETTWLEQQLVLTAEMLSAELVQEPCTPQKSVRFVEGGKGGEDGEYGERADGCEHAGEGTPVKVHRQRGARRAKKQSEPKFKEVAVQTHAVDEEAALAMLVRSGRLQRIIAGTCARALQAAADGMIEMAASTEA